jgi:hypothetical protein
MPGTTPGMTNFGGRENREPGMTSMGASITYRCSVTWRLDSLRLLIRLRVLETVKKSRRETLPADRSMT